MCISKSYHIYTQGIHAKFNDSDHEKNFFQANGSNNSWPQRKKKKPQKPSILVVSIVFYSDFMHAEDLKL